jgi:hypothetical protein
MAENERVVVKRGKKLMNIISQDDPIMGWLDGTLLREYLEIPAEFRVNPFDISPSGDVFWADRRNVEELDRRLANRGETIVLTEEEQRKLFSID